MNDFVTALTIVTAYHLMTSLIGLAAAFMGFLLFRYGVFDRTADLKNAWGERGLMWKQAAPGTFFCVLGAVIIAISVVAGVKATWSASSPEATRTVLQASGYGRAPSTPLSVLLRHALADFAVCSLATGTDQAEKDKCYKHMKTVDLNYIPTADDLKLIDELEAKDQDSQTTLTALRNRYFKPQK